MITAISHIWPPNSVLDRARRWLAGDHTPFLICNKVRSVPSPSHPSTHDNIVTARQRPSGDHTVNHIHFHYPQTWLHLPQPTPAQPAAVFQHSTLLSVSSSSLQALHLPHPCPAQAHFSLDKEWPARINCCCSSSCCPETSAVASSGSSNFSLNVTGVFTVVGIAVLILTFLRHDIRPGSCEATAGG